jgi:hypothetical protein
MTTYARIQCGCPITRKCLRELQGMVKPGTLAETVQETIDELIERAASISDHPDYVKLRGFLVIETLLHTINLLYQRYWQPGENLAALSIRERSWLELTHLKVALELLLDQVQLEVAEQQLGGLSTTVKHSLKFPVLASSGTQRVQAAIQMRPFLGNTIDCIVALRPYLKNENVSVSCLGERLCSSFYTLYGGTAVTPVIQATQKLLEVRL